MIVGVSYIIGYPTTINKRSLYITWLGLIVPGHQAMVGSLIPPSNVVSLPHRNGALLPPGIHDNKNNKSMLAGGYH